MTVKGILESDGIAALEFRSDGGHQTKLFALAHGEHNLGVSSSARQVYPVFGAALINGLAIDQIANRGVEVKVGQHLKVEVPGTSDVVISVHEI